MQTVAGQKKSDANMTLDQLENFRKESEQSLTPLPALDYPDLPNVVPFIAPSADSRALLPSLDYPAAPQRRQRKPRTSRKPQSVRYDFGGADD